MQELLELGQQHRLLKTAFPIPYKSPYAAAASIKHQQPQVQLQQHADTIQMCAMQYAQQQQHLAAVSPPRNTLCTEDLLPHTLTRLRYTSTSGLAIKMAAFPPTPLRLHCASTVQKLRTQL
jgi:hypothetical protein